MPIRGFTRAVRRKVKTRAREATREQFAGHEHIPHPQSTAIAGGRRILAEAIERYRPVKVFGLFSGGHDSLCACHLASTQPRFDGCVHVNTGIGIEETREFVCATCRDHGWPLIEFHPPVSYDQIVLRWELPLPASGGRCSLSVLLT